MVSTIKITQIKSIIGHPEKQRRIVRGLGLKKMNQTVELADTPATRGMVAKVAHLVRISGECKCD